jgi:hypothetical protein
MKSLVWKMIAAGCIILGMTACSSDESNSNNSKVEVWLTDAPGDFQEVNVDIQAVEINSTEGESGWKSLSVKKGIYNLLTLTNGLDTLLGEVEIPAGKISQIRLTLGENNSIKIANAVQAISTPSAQQSGLKLLVNETLSAGITYKILLDFDVARSIVKTGNSGYKLKPVIRTIAQAQTGAIKGVVSPVVANPAVLAINGQDTVATSYCDSTGHFLLRGLAAGDYKVEFVPSSEYQVVEKTSVGVQVGVVNDLGTVSIPHQ